MIDYFFACAANPPAYADGDFEYTAFVLERFEESSALFGLDNGVQPFDSISFPMKTRIKTGVHVAGADQRVLSTCTCINKGATNSSAEGQAPHTSAPGRGDSRAVEYMHILLEIMRRVQAADSEVYSAAQAQLNARLQREARNQGRVPCYVAQMAWFQTFFAAHCPALHGARTGQGCSFKEMRNMKCKLAGQDEQGNAALGLRDARNSSIARQRQIQTDPSTNTQFFRKLKQQYAHAQKLGACGRPAETSHDVPSGDALRERYGSFEKQCMLLQIDESAWLEWAHTRHIAQTMTVPRATG